MATSAPKNSAPKKRKQPYELCKAMAKDEDEGEGGGKNDVGVGGGAPTPSPKKRRLRKRGGFALGTKEVRIGDGNNNNKDEFDGEGREEEEEEEGGEEGRGGKENKGDGGRRTPHDALTDAEGRELDWKVTVNNPHTLQKFVEIVHSMMPNLPLEVKASEDATGLHLCAQCESKTRFVQGAMSLDVLMREGAARNFCIPAKALLAQYDIVPSDGVVSLQRRKGDDASVSFMIYGTKGQGDTSTVISCVQGLELRLDSSPPVLYEIRIKKALIQAFLNYATKIKTERIGFRVRHPRHDLPRQLEGMPPDSMARHNMGDVSGGESTKTRSYIEFAMRLDGGELPVTTDRPFFAMRGDDDDGVFEVDEQRDARQMRLWAKQDRMVESFQQQYSVQALAFLTKMDNKDLTLQLYDQGPLSITYPLTETDWLKVIVGPSVKEDDDADGRVSARAEFNDVPLYED
jgi:hypothetical protein